MQFDAGDAITQIDERGAGVAAHDAMAGAEIRDARDACWARDWLVALTRRVVTGCAVFAIPGSRAARQHRLDDRADALARRLHAFHGVADAHRIPHLEWAELPVVTGAHRTIDAGRRVGDLRQAVGRVVPQPRQQLPVEARGLVLLLVAAQGACAAARERLHVLCHLERRQLRLRRWLIFERLQIEHQAHFLAICAALLLVKAAAGLVAQPLALQHRFKKRRECRPGRLRPALPWRSSAPHARGCPAHHVRQPEGAGARKANGGAGQRIHLLHAQTLFLHHAECLQDEEGADAVGDEIRRVASADDLFAEVLIEETGKRRHRRRIGIRAGNDFHQAHVTRRIEEVRAEPAAAQFRGQHAGNRGDGNAAGVRGQDGVRLHMRRDARQQLLLDLEIFRYRLDDPVAFGELRQIVIEVAGANARGGGWRVKSGRLALLQRVERLVRNGVAGAIARGQIQQQDADAGIGQMSGDARSHGARAQHRCLAQQRGRARLRCDVLAPQQLPCSPRRISVGILTVYVSVRS